MQLLVITDRFGEIVATARMDAGEGAPTVARLVPAPGQSLHAVDIDEGLLESASVADAHERIRASLPAPPSLGEG